MAKCALCVDGTCSSDCPALDLFPSDKEDGRVLAKKVTALGFKTEFIKDCLRAAKVSGGGLDLQKDFISKLVLGHTEGGENLAKDSKIITEIKEAKAKNKKLIQSMRAQKKIHKKRVKHIVDAAFPDGL